MHKHSFFLFICLLFCYLTANAQFCETPIGFGRNASGGVGGAVYAVTNLNDAGSGSLRAGLESNDRLIIRFAVTGTVNLNSDINVKSNKTVDGDGTYIRIRPYGFRINRQNNIIIRNLHFDSDGQVHSGATGDAITIQNESTNIWIDHCTFEDYYDGLIDIIRESDHITVSWCYFKSHQKVMLIGHSDGHTVDAGKLNVTVHHNYYDGTTQRHPRIRFGRAHVFNNYLRNISEMGLCSGTDAQMVIENNRFENVVKPAVLQYDSNWQGYITESGNQRINTVALLTRPPTFDPSSLYTYSLETANNTLRDFLVAYTGYNKTTNMAITVNGNTMTANYLARSFQWYRDGVAINGATSNAYTTAVCGNYSVRLYGDQGCFKELAHTINTTLPTAPVISVTSSTSYFCSGGNVALRASESPAGYSYLWSRNNADINEAISRDYVATQQGDYRVRYIGPCSSLVSEKLFVEDKGSPDCNGICNGAAVIDDCGDCHLPDDENFNASCTGCDGVVNSGFEIDTCGKCLYVNDAMFNICTITDIKNNHLPDNLQVQLYPNPFFDRLNVCVEGDSSENLLIELFTVDGRKISEKNMQKQCVELVNLPVADGIYLVHIRNNDKLLYVGKVMRN
jgi:pectate lyase